VAPSPLDIASHLKANAGFFLTAMLDFMSKLEAVYNALEANVWTISFFGVLIPLVISCLWMVFFFFFAGIAVYIAIFLLVTVLFVTTGVCAYKGGLSTPFLDNLVLQSMEYAETVIWRAHCCARQQQDLGDNAQRHAPIDGR
jgi:uncharacterized protein YacL